MKNVHLWALLLALLIALAALLASSAGTLLNCIVDTVLTGGTSTNGKVNISADGSTGKIYIENRRGGTTSFSWLEIG